MTRQVALPPTLAPRLSNRDSAAAYQDNIRIVIELSNLAVIVTESLKRAPEIRRGRQ